MSLPNEVMELLKEDFSKLCGSRKDQAYYFNLLKPMEPIFVEARKKGISFVKIAKTLSDRGVHVPTAILQEFIQASTGEKKRVSKKKRKLLKSVDLNEVGLSETSERPVSNVG